MGSSRKTDNKILGVEFLRDLANAEMTTAYAEALRKRYPEIAGPVWKDLRNWIEDLVWMQRYLRAAWEAHNDRHRAWHLHEMRRRYSHSSAMVPLHPLLPLQALPLPSDVTPPLPMTPKDVPAFEKAWKEFFDPPKITPFESALFYFQSVIGNRAKYCGHTDCPAPYFIANKRWQKFCSEECAGPANRESKRKWWNDHRAMRS